MGYADETIFEGRLEKFDQPRDVSLGEDMQTVMIEAPFAGRGETEEERAADAKQNFEYLVTCLRNSLCAGEAPMSPIALEVFVHIPVNGVEFKFDDNPHRNSVWRSVVDVTRFCIDRGWSRRMVVALQDALENTEPIEIWGDHEKVPPPLGFVYVITETFAVHSDGLRNMTSREVSIREGFDD